MRVEEIIMDKPLAEIGVGECFRFVPDGSVYMRMNDIYSNGEKFIKCVRLEDGQPYEFYNDLVTPVNAKVVIE